MFDTVLLVVNQGGRLVTLGLVVGLISALGLTRVLQSQLHDVSGLDPLAYGAAALVLASAAVLACVLPARRAARLDPMVALRED